MASSKSPGSEAPPPAEPVFWFGFEVTWAKLALGRVVIFTMLSIDALLQISHAPRYSAGDFNVAQLPLFDAIGPTRALYSSGQLVLAYLFMLTACGVATRIVLPIVAAIYGWLYFGSHLDSYQHHYLVWLVVVLACGVPWQPPTGATATTRVRSWALRLILVQLGILYLWAAVSKLDGAWLDGRTLAGQIHGSMRGLIDATVGIAVTSWLVVVAELALSVSVWRPRAWRFAAPLGILLHLGIVWTGLEIGLFAWLMLALYILILPDRVWTWLAARRPLVGVAALARVFAGWFDGAGWLLLVFSAGLGVGLAALSRFDHALAISLALVGMVTVAAVTLRRRVSIAALAGSHLLALVTWTLVDRSTSTAADYYRFWGGSSRRLGDSRAAEHAYRMLVDIAPNEGAGHYQLGRLYLARDASDQGIAELHAAQSLEPLQARAYVAEARWLAAHGRRAEAIAKAREAIIVEPSDAEARSVLDSLLGSQR